MPVPYPDNPNGSMANTAGVCDATGRVLGLMPHPERHIDPTHHPRWTRGEGRQPGDGLAVFRNAVEYFAEATPPRAASRKLFPPQRPLPRASAADRSSPLLEHSRPKIPLGTLDRRLGVRTCAVRAARIFRRLDLGRLHLPGQHMTGAVTHLGHRVLLEVVVAGHVAGQSRRDLSSSKASITRSWIISRQAELIGWAMSA